MMAESRRRRGGRGGGGQGQGLLFLAALLSLSSSLATCARAMHEARLYHTLGSDGRETLLGRLEAHPGGSIAIAIAPAASAPAAVAQGLRELIEAGRPYSLRLSTRLGVPEGGRARHVVSSVPAACAAQLLLPPLPAAKGRRTSSGDRPGAQLLLHVSAAGAPVAIEVDAAGGGGGALSCDRAAALRQLEHHSSSEGAAPLPELRVEVVSPSVAPPVPITTQAPGQAQAQAQAQQQQQAGGGGSNGTAGGNSTRGGGPPPKDERTFLQKNGLFIVGGAMMALNVLLRPDPAPARGGGGGGGGGGARPAPQRRQG